VCLILLSTVAAPQAWGDAVRLRPSACIKAGEPITLGDVAELEGERARAFTNAVLVEDPALRSLGRGWVEIGIDEVRLALRDADARPARVAVSGAACVVRVLEAERAAEPVPETPAPEAVPARSIDPEGAPTVATEVARVLSQVLGVDWQSLRLRFDQADRPFADRTVVGLKAAVTPMSSAGARMVLVVRLFAGDSLVEQRTVGVEAEVKRSVVVLRADVARRRTIESEALSLVEMWVAPGGSPPVESIDEAAGSLARTRLETGAVLRRDVIEAAIAVRRGELATVHCLRGGVVLQTRARARRDGRVGEVIEFRVDGSARSFNARISAPGIAVANLDETAVAAAEIGR